jgi:hypothetical protein
MDTLAHGIAAYLVGSTGKSKVDWRWLAFFGMWPDLVWLPFTALQFLTRGNLYFFQGPYNISHSLVIWAALSALAMFKWRNAFAYSWPWALHILIDIPGHITMPTPILWPISDWHIVGWFDWLSWPWFPLTYVGFIVIYVVLWKFKRLMSVRRNKKTANG